MADLMARRPIKVEARKMGNRDALGLAYPAERRIEIDFDAHKAEKELLDTIIHEILHVSSQDWLSEKAIELIAEDIADVLHRQKWRRIH